MRRYWIGCFLVVITGCVALLSVALAASNFVPIKLLHGVQVELPRNWKALSSNQRITLDAAVQSRNEPAGIFDASSDLHFGANYYDDSGKAAASMNIRYYPDSDISQAEAHAVMQSEVRELDRALRESIVKAGQVNGLSVLRWGGTRKQVINGITAFVTEYKRSSQKDSGNFKVRLVRVFDRDKSFTLTVSYREDQEYLLRPICDRVISSLRK
ncbi:MAG: hypothetical protein EG828_12575 [Deltaproteobacteria bacterium]|nr:hypothetical protein [Deltaproteobacteria bacterium]